MNNSRSRVFLSCLFVCGVWMLHPSLPPRMPAAVEVALAQPAAPICEPAGKDEAKCETSVAKALLKAGVCLHKCAIGRATGKLDDAARQACETGDPKKSCKAKYDRATSSTSKIDPLCPSCLDAARRAELFNEKKVVVEVASSDVFCCPATTTTTLEPNQCGNGVLDPGEQCDDGNVTNIDGCDSACRFEQAHRINHLVAQFTADASCTSNAFGGAILGALVQQELQAEIDSGISDGSLSVLLLFLGIDDLTGWNDSDFNVGVLRGSPVFGTGYDGADDVDWWYTVSAASIDANRTPVTTLSGDTAAGVLSVGPGRANLPLQLFSTPTILEMSELTLTSNNGAVSQPLVSSGGPPGHLASENLDPTLASWETSGTKAVEGAGSMCGNISAASLAATPIPASLAGCSLFSCSQCYTAANSMLDLLVGGCNTVAGQQVVATQPDEEDPDVAGVGPYFFTTGADRAVNGCTAAGGPAQLGDCLADAAYSSYFQFATDRVIAK